MAPSYSAATVAQIEQHNKEVRGQPISVMLLKSLERSLRLEVMSLRLNY